MPRSGGTEAAQFSKELGIGDGGAVSIVDHGIAFGGEAGNGEGHGDAMIAARFDFRAMHFAGVAALDAQAIGEFFHLGAHLPKIFGESGDAIAFFHAQLSSVANLDAFFGERPESSEHGQLVNQQGHESARNVATLQGSAVDAQITDQFTLRALQIEDSERSAHGLEEIENGRTGRIQAHIGDEEIRFRQQRRSGDEEHGRGDISRDIEGLGLQRASAGAVRHALNDDGAAALCDMRAEEFEGEFGMIARLGGFRDLRFTAGVEAGEQDSGLHLSAGHGHLVVNAVKMAAANLERRKIAVARLNFRAHLEERGYDALHGALLKRGIAGNPGGEILPAEDSGEQADGGAGIFRVEGAPRAFQAAEAAAGDFDGATLHFHIRAERLHAAERAVTIARGGKVAEFAGAFGKSGEHGVAMRNGFVAGKFEGAGEGLGGMNGLVFHDAGSWIEFSTGRFVAAGARRIAEKKEGDR